MANDPQYGGGGSSNVSGNPTGGPTSGGADFDWSRVPLGFATGGLSEVANYLGGQASQGYNTAAQGAQGASQNYGQLGNWDWNTAMGGMGQANAAYAPSQSLWNNTYGSQGPNAKAQWWGQNQGNFNQPTATSGALSQYGNYMAGGPTNANSAYQNNQSILGGQSQAGQYNARYGGQLTGDYSSAERAYDPTQYQNPGAAENFTNYAQNRIGGQGATQELQYGDVNNMGNFANGLQNQQGVGATTAGAGEIGNLYRGANDVSQYAGSQMGQLQGPGAYEQFVQSDINGTNPQNQRETDQGVARINQEMARRGHFNSGGADTAIGNFVGSQAAADYQNKANRAQSAQQMELSRIGAGQSLSQASAQGKLAQGQSLQSLAGQTDAETMGRLQQQLSAQQGASGEGLANRQGALNYAQAADQTSLGRTQALAGINSQAQQMQLARLQGGMGAAGQSDAGMLNRLNAGYNMSQGADQSDLARAMGLYGMAQGSDQSNLARYGMLGSLSGQQDQANLGQLMGGGNMANQTAGANQNQMNDAFRAQFGMNNAQANNISNFYGMGMGAYDQSMGNSYNALANYYQLMGQGQGAAAAVPWQMANTAANFMPYKMGK